MDDLALVPILAESDALFQRLRAVGVDAESMDDFAARAGDFDAHVDDIIQLLSSIRSRRVKDGFVRTIAKMPAAKGRAVPELIRQFRQAHADHDRTLGWTVGLAIGATATPHDFERLAEIATDRRYGTTRQMLVEGLGRLNHPDCRDTLVSLLGDEDVVGHAVRGLRQLKDPSAIAAVGPLSEHPRTWVRNEARSTLRALEKARTRKASPPRQPRGRDH